ncbi:phosphatase PAP2 family protein [Streptomyces sp. NPDC048623]|uniref:phosphatase PAP2 family protein n=1 Tax=Streptomyces sp. NPDC048623 TaxID=3155761 RepID=UPI0034333DB0
MGETTVKTSESRTTPSSPTVADGRFTRVLRARTPRRPRIWFEVLLIGLSYWLYSLIRNAVPEQKTQALKNADWIWQTEHALGLAFEQAVNHAVNSVTWLIVSMNYYYATLHFIITIGVLVWLYRWQPGRYAAFRTVLFATTAVALVGYYLYPLAPPRLMNGQHFVDTVLVHHTWGSMASGNLKHMSNQYAAMPSMHIGWSLWCGLTIFLLAKAPWARVLGLLYPMATLVVIVATANHFWMDAVGGILCLTFGFAVSYVWYGSHPHKLPKLVAAPAASTPQGVGRGGGQRAETDAEKAGRNSGPGSDRDSDEESDQDEKVGSGSRTGR